MAAEDPPTSVRGSVRVSRALFEVREKGARIVLVFNVANVKANSVQAGPLSHFEEGKTGRGARSQC